MTIMNTELYEALVAAGAPDDKAKAAANVMEEQNKRFDAVSRRFDKVDNEISSLRKDMEHGFDRLDKKIDTQCAETHSKIDLQGISLTSKIDAQNAELKILKWGIGVVLSGVVTLIILALKTLLSQ